MLSYEGIFFDENALKIIKANELYHLPILNDIIHCTFKYHPLENEIFDELVGKEFEITLIGYGCDGKNSGFQIKLPDELINYYINYDEDNNTKLKIPHITTSLSEGAKASDTKNLNFIPLEDPITIIGKFGYWIKDENKEYVSFEPYKNIKKI